MCEGDRRGGARDGAGGGGGSGHAQDSGSGWNVASSHDEDFNTGGCAIQLLFFSFIQLLPRAWQSLELSWVHEFSLIEDHPVTSTPTVTPHLADEETDAQRHEMNCPASFCR